MKKRKPSTKPKGQSAIQAKLAKHAENIRTMAKRAVQNIIGIGRELTEAKKLVRHGHYVDWLEKEFDWSVGTALNFTRVYEFVEGLKSKNINFTNLDLSDLEKVNIAPSALYLLARPNTPEEVRNEMIERAATGEEVSHKAVQAALTAHKGANGTVAMEPPASTAESPPTESEVQKSEGQEEQEGEAQAQDQDPLRDLEPQLRWKVIEARHWLDAAKKHALEAVKYGHPAEQHIDPEVLRHAVGDKEQLDKLCFILHEGGRGGLSTLADKLERAYEPAAPVPPPMFEESASGDASSDSTTPDATPDQA